MPNRTCVACGKSRGLTGAKVCERADHFVCDHCVKYTSMWSTLTKCPLDKSNLK